MSVCIANSAYSENKALPVMLKKTKSNMMPRILGGYDPCLDDYAKGYYNKPEVQKALHVSNGLQLKNWSICNMDVFDGWKQTKGSVLPIYKKLIDAKLRIWVCRFVVYISALCDDALEGKNLCMRQWTVFFSTHLGQKIGITVFKHWNSLKRSWHFSMILEFCFILQDDCGHALCAGYVMTMKVATEMCMNCLKVQTIAQISFTSSCNRTPMMVSRIKMGKLLQI